MFKQRITWAVLVYLALSTFRSPAEELDPQVSGKKVSEWKAILSAAADNERHEHVMTLLNSHPLPAALLPVCLELLPRDADEFPYSRQLLPELILNICMDSPQSTEVLFAELEKGSDERRMAVMKAVRGLTRRARPAVPKLLDTATNEKESERLRCFALYALQTIPCDAAVALPRLKPLLGVQNKELCMNAVQAIGALGVDARPAINDLVILLKDPAKDSYLRGEAAMALGHIGHGAKDAVPAMIDFLHEVDTPSTAIEALGWMGSDAAPAVPVLMMKLHDTNSAMINVAARALGRIGKAARPAVPELIRLIKETERLEDRRSLTWAVGSFCADAQEALPLLVDLMAKDHWGASNPSPTEQAVMKVAATAWWEGTMERAEVEKHISSVRDALAWQAGQYTYEMKDTSSVNAAAHLRLARALPRFAIRLGVKDDFLSRLLDAADENPDAEVKVNAMIAREEWKTKKLLPLPLARPLAALAVQTPAVSKEPQYGGHTLAEWITALKSERTKIDAEIALPHCGPEGVRALLHRDHDGVLPGLDLSQLSEVELNAIAPVLIEAMGDTDVLVRRSAPAWIELLPAGTRKAAVPALINALNDADVPVRRWAAQALGHIGADAKEAVPQLIDALEHKDRDLRGMALGALGGIGPAAKDAVPTLIAHFRKEKDEYERFSIPFVLGKIGPVTPEVIPTMLAALKDPGMNTRNCAAQGLGEMHVAEAVPALLEVLKSPHEESIVRNSVAQALGKLGASKEAIEPLAEMARNTKMDWQSRGAAMNALVLVDADGTIALKTLEGNLSDSDALVLINTADAIAMLGEKAKPAVAAISKMLIANRDKSEGFETARLEAVQALAKIGKCDEAIKALESATNDPNEIVARVAKEALLTLKK